MNGDKITLIDIEAIIHMWRAGLISEQQAIIDIQIQLNINDDEKRESNVGST